MQSLGTWSGRGLRALWGAAGMFMLALTIPTGPAEAQGLFDLLFGGSLKPAPVVGPMPWPRASSGGNQGGVFRPEGKSSFSDGDGERSGGTYRTVCVRMCDGFFVPMSYATTRSNFQQDQYKCRATCGDDARLFFHRSPGGAMEEAVDLGGRTYGRLPNAFRFRKTLVEGCSCRPPPWSEAELARHRAYAAGPQSPVPGQPLPPSVKVAQASTKPAPVAAQTAAEQSSSADVDGESIAAATPAPKSSNFRTAGRTRTTTSETPRVIRAAAQVPATGKPPGAQSKPGQSNAGQSNAGQSNPGLFGYNGTTSMGLTGKSKFVWPGD